MANHPPKLIVPYVAAHWQDLHAKEEAVWGAAVRLPGLQLADGSGPARQQTAVRLFHNRRSLCARFDCVDEDIWGTFTKRDDPIYDEEVVEVFLAPGETTPIHYYEFEVSPNGTLLDARINNPTGDRADLQADFAWDCPDLQWAAVRRDDENFWQATLVIPLAPLSSTAPPSRWRANFYRIERPRGLSEEYSCWSSTRTDPADFHKPDRFGYLELG